MTDLNELADRVEKLDGPCRETDALVGIAVQSNTAFDWFWKNFSEWKADESGRIYVVHENGKTGPHMRSPNTPPH